MSESNEEWKKAHRKSGQESVEFFGSQRKFERETWVVRQLLAAIGTPFQEDDFEVADEPADVSFRDARFQVKEIMEQGRRRHDEFRQYLTDIDTARNEADLSEPYTSQVISFSEVVDLVIDRAFELATTKYGAAERDSLDLLCYFNWSGYSVVPPLEFGNIDSPFRSISVVSNTYCAVLFTASTAPEFLMKQCRSVILSPVR